MIPVFQTTFGFPGGNCMEAALASLFEIELEAIPRFEGDEWVEDYENWMIEKFGIQPVRATGDFVPKGYHLIVGKSPRGDFDHVIVGFQGKPVHDPYPDGECELKTVDCYELFVKVMT